MAKGVIRKIDDLGRLCLPIEFRRAQNIEPEEYLEILSTNEGILVRKVNEGCIICDSTVNLINTVGYDKKICLDCVNKAKTRANNGKYDKAIK